MVNRVREGYKMTELGEVPKEWKVSNIGEYIEQKSIKNKNLEVINVVSVTKYMGIVNSLEYFDKQVFSKDISTYKIIEKDASATKKLSQEEKDLADAEKMVADNTKKEVGHLNALYKAATDTLQPMEKRMQWVQQLKKEFPDYFKDLTDEAFGSKSDESRQGTCLSAEDGSDFRGKRETARGD